MANQPQSRETIIAGQAHTDPPGVLIAWSIVPLIPAIVGFFYFVAVGKIF